METIWGYMGIIWGQYEKIYGDNMGSLRPVDRCNMTIQCDWRILEDTGGAFAEAELELPKTAVIPLVHVEHCGTRHMIFRQK